MGKSSREEKEARVNGMVEQMKPPKGKFRHMSIEGAENGVSIRTEREKQKDDNDGDEKSPSTTYGGDSSTTVHTDMDSVLDHVRKHVAGHFKK